MPTKSRSAHCIANGIRLHYLDFNEEAAGAPILLLPGITSPAATWSFVAERLALNRRVLVMDIRGRGLSENRPGLGYTLNDYAQDAWQFIDVLGLELPVVIGHSMGARIAARLGAMNGRIASKFILVDPPLSGPGRAPYPTPLNSYLSAIAAASRGATVEEFRKFTPSWTDEQIALRLEWLPTCGVEAVTETHRNFHEEDIFPDFPRLSYPTLLIYAALARVVTPDMAEEIANSLPAGRAISIQAGHMVPWDNLEDFIELTQQFIQPA